jgi:hypothetical protein
MSRILIVRFSKTAFKIVCLILQNLYLSCSVEPDLKRLRLGFGTMTEGFPRLDYHDEDEAVRLLTLHT